MSLKCAGCGQPVLVSKQGFQEHTEAGGFWVWHHACPPPWQRKGWPQN